MFQNKPSGKKEKLETPRIRCEGQLHNITHLTLKEPPTPKGGKKCSEIYSSTTFGHRYTVIQFRQKRKTIQILNEMKIDLSYIVNKIFISQTNL